VLLGLVVAERSQADGRFNCVGATVGEGHRVADASSRNRDDIIATVAPIDPYAWSQTTGRKQAQQGESRQAKPAAFELFVRRTAEVSAGK
jgi:hypothetical protein